MSYSSGHKQGEMKSKCKPKRSLSNIKYIHRAYDYECGYKKQTNEKILLELRKKFGL